MFCIYVFEFLFDMFVLVFVFACFLDFIGMLGVCNPQVCVLAAGENQSKKNGRHCNLLEDGGASAYKTAGNPNREFRCSLFLRIMEESIDR